MGTHRRGTDGQAGAGQGAPSFDFGRMFRAVADGTVFAGLTVAAAAGVGLAIQATLWAAGAVETIRTNPTPWLVGFMLFVGLGFIGWVRGDDPREGMSETGHELYTRRLRDGPCGRE